MRALGDVDEDELLIGSEDDSSMAGPASADIPPPISGLRRQLLLTRLVISANQASPDQAAALAQELARLLDQIHTERLSFDDLPALVPDKFAEHWQITLKFLTILTNLWPAILADEGTIDPADHRNRLLKAQADAWQNNPPSIPVIAAGSTGSIPATADLLRVIAHLPKGRVILPGLDQEADQSTWDNLEAHHPQYGMARLIEHIGIERSEIKIWNGGDSRENSLRSQLLNESLRPSKATAPAPNSPKIDRKRLADALAGVRRIDCPTAQDEAGAIALLMRQTLETPGKTAGLITPDRTLARRVAAELKRWDIEVDDSAGIPLSQTPPGGFLRLVARMATENLAPVAILSALKHPLASGGMEPGQFRMAVRQLEVACLRGPRPEPGTDGIRKLLTTTDELAQNLLGILDDACQSFNDLMAQTSLELPLILQAHMEMAERLASSLGKSGRARLWVGNDGETLAGFISELHQSGETLGPISPTLYPALLDILMAGGVVRPVHGRHPRLFIWGLLEARLQRADLMILGGLNEGTWPPEIQANPWMSRPMMQDFGLPLPERRIGLSAHDFAQAFAAPDVVISRAERVDGTPTVPSRWMLRLNNRLHAEGSEIAIPKDDTPVHWFNQLDSSQDNRRIKAPRPTPPVEVRPTRLSVTRVETLHRDPYAIYAGQILKLRPLDPIDADPGAADKGTIIHKALEVFIRKHPGELPQDALELLIQIGRQAFQENLNRPGVRAFWWPRFLRIADWFINFERQRRLTGITIVGTEVKGEYQINTGTDRPFTLSAVADRIDRNIDGSLIIIDYKTGAPPSVKQVESGLVPQLTLEAAMLSNNGFEGMPPAPVSDLVYLQLSGGRIAGQEKPLKLDVEQSATDALESLRQKIAAYNNPKMPYLSRPRPKFAGRFRDYDHLARVKEWLAGEEGGSE